MQQPDRAGPRRCSPGRAAADVGLIVATAADGASICTRGFQVPDNIEHYVADCSPDIALD